MIITPDSIKTGQEQELSQVASYAREIGEFYHISTDRVEDVASNTTINYVDQDAFCVKVEEYLVSLSPNLATALKPLFDDPDSRSVYESLGTSTEDIQVMQNRIRSKLREDLLKNAGVCIRKDDGYEIAVLDSLSPDSQDHAIRHEVFHALATNSEGGGFQDEVGQHHTLNEASTELLNIHQQHPDLSINDLIKAIQDNKIKCAYQDIVLKLLSCLLSTESSKTPISIQKLANYYFDSTKDGSMINCLRLQWDIIRSAYPPTKPIIERLLESLTT
jgi:hypothetical protein